MPTRLKGCIPVADLIIGGVYLVKARNFSLGMWNGREFIGPRFKFGDTFLDTEIHWDLDERYGTAQPLELLYTDADAEEKLEEYIEASSKRLGLSSDKRGI